MLLSFLDAALPEEEIICESILPAVIIIAVIVAAVFLVRFEMKKKSRKEAEACGTALEDGDRNTETADNGPENKED